MDNGKCKTNIAQPLERSEALPLTGERGEGLGMGNSKPTLLSLSSEARLSP